MTSQEVKDLQKELDNTIQFQRENIESGYFDIAEELETDITYLKTKLKDNSCEYSHL